eukprot:CAMPEP_0198281518 /NCGR_PEP_ID=MMETSP1449-20131203/1438_1 /TAXON_ID=420275 /ORGANISM="Attheya septentrionalis, Strain CCMP2084" /LENGTH=340 /DNA_ID=CAMNT_0043977319 /DNA_START=170 /DNA_END=1192 /DNA_ORIENTATION=-
MSSVTDPDTFRFTTLDESPMDDDSIIAAKITSRDLVQVLRVAEKAAFLCGDIIQATSGDIAVSKTKSNARDLVTESDVECQRIIRSTICQEYPQDYFLGEEDVEAGSEASIEALSSVLDSSASAEPTDDTRDRLLWIVDPIDGTTNFQAGLPMCAVSIGVVLVSKDKDVPSEVVVGVIYNPILNEITSAVKGKGSYLNGNRIHVTEGGNDEIELSDALINVGFPAVKDSTLQAASRAVGALATKVRGLRMIASASQVMCWVAQGKLSAYVSWDLNAWDVAAGMLIVEESCGHVTDFDGQRASISSRDLIVTCPEGMCIQEESPLARKILRVLSENDCLEY